MKKSISLLPLLFSGIISQAQNEVDALRYSATDVVGTARYQALGGAFTSLGVDMTTAATNPAGIAVNRSSQFQFSPAVYGISANSTLNGNKTSDFKLNANVGSWGFIGTIKNRWNKNKDTNTGLQSFSIGVTYTRMNNFHQVFLSENPNSTSSLLDSYAQNISGVSSSTISSSDQYSFGENMAYQSYLLNPDTVLANQYTTVASKPGNRQTMQGDIKGRVGETNITFGANVANKLYLGGGIGISRIRYYEKTNYTESDYQNQINGFQDFTLSRNLSTVGTGYNVKIGAIYRPTDWLRLGASAISPTFYMLTDNWNNTLSSNLDTASYLASSPQGTYNYNLTSAPRFYGGVGFIIGKIGLISADYELINYPFARFSANDGYSFTAENSATKALYRTTGNVRIGTEWKVQNIALRGGVALFASPYKTPSSYFNKINYSLGLGYSGKVFFCDATYVLSMWKNTYTVYELQNSKGEVADLKYNTGNVVLTFGVKF